MHGRLRELLNTMGTFFALDAHWGMMTSPYLVMRNRIHLTHL